MPIHRLTPNTMWGMYNTAHHTVRAGNTVYISGQVAVDEHGNDVAAGAHVGRKEVRFGGAPMRMVIRRTAPEITAVEPQLVNRVSVQRNRWGRRA